jgi:hypothetical protein
MNVPFGLPPFPAVPVSPEFHGRFHDREGFSAYPMKNLRDHERPLRE